MRGVGERTKYRKVYRKQEKARKRLVNASVKASEKRNLRRASASDEQLEKEVDAAISSLGTGYEGLKRVVLGGGDGEVVVGVDPGTPEGSKTVTTVVKKPRKKKQAA